MWQKDKESSQGKTETPVQDQDLAADIPSNPTLKHMTSFAVGIESDNTSTNPSTRPGSVAASVMTAVSSSIPGTYSEDWDSDRTFELSPSQSEKSVKTSEKQDQEEEDQEEEEEEASSVDMLDAFLGKRVRLPGEGDSGEDSEEEEGGGESWDADEIQIEYLDDVMLGDFLFRREMPIHGVLQVSNHPVTPPPLNPIHLESPNRNKRNP